MSSSIKFSPHSVEYSDKMYNKFQNKYSNKLQQIKLLDDQFEEIDKLVYSLESNNDVPQETIQRSIDKSIIRLTELYKDAFTTTKNRDFLIARNLVKELTNLKETYKENTKIAKLHTDIKDILYRCQTGDSLPLDEIEVENNNGYTINTVAQLLSYMENKNDRNKIVYTRKLKRKFSSSGKKRKTKRKTKRKHN